MKRFVPAAIVIVMLAGAAPASARGPGGGGGRGASGVIRQLVFPCQAACQAAARECSAALESAAIDCVSAACGAEITAAQDACASDRSSEACRTAISALRDCGSGCIDTQRTNQTTCREAHGDCIDACSAEE